MRTNLNEYATGLLNKISKLIESPMLHKDETRKVHVEDLCGLVQLAQAAASNLKDVDRLDFVQAFLGPSGGIRIFQIVLLAGNKKGVGFGPCVRSSIDDVKESPHA